MDVGEPHSPCDFLKWTLNDDYDDESSIILLYFDAIVKD